MSNKEGYTEYGYRGLEEIRRLQSEIDVDTFNPGGTD